MILVVGQVRRPHGIRGEVVVEVRTDTPEERFTAGARLLTEPAEAGPLTVKSVRNHSGSLLVRFAGVADRDAAERLKGVLLAVDSATLPDTGDPDEFYDHQLIGLAAELADGTRVGEVVDVLHHSQDVLVLRLPDGGEALVPFVGPIVPEVDLDGGRLVLDPPPGLLELG
ncbi:ribosome maturation factor RimM [Allonocardiopsis opalescens]|uniref:ribosome maturation factor RimM n=1 Tax=Allonocardiopsis opalescens TaxID=1144618 RepID=UPI000D062E1E|nr:ribosome maturation factor RimM [Allonocardiopsis opalescens]